MRMTALVLTAAFVVCSCAVNRGYYSSDLNRHEIPEPKTCSDAQLYIGECNTIDILNVSRHIPKMDCISMSKINTLCKRGDVIKFNTIGFSSELCDFSKQIVTNSDYNFVTCVKR